jgi:protein arginine kinase
LEITEMNLDTLLPNLGEWLRGTGPESDVVVSTRIRLARNLAGLPFATRATAAHKAEVVTRAKDAVAKAEGAHTLEYLDIPSLANLDRQFLVERQLISRELAGGIDGPRGVAFDSTESASVMVNDSTTPSKPASATPSTRNSATSPRAPPTSAPECAPA